MNVTVDRCSILYFDKVIGYLLIIGRSNMMLRTLDAQQSGPRFESSGRCFEARGLSFTVRWPNSLICIYGYLAIDSNGYM